MEQSDAKHAGLNMLEELAWINSFLDKGTYAVNWGPGEVVAPKQRKNGDSARHFTGERQRYWAELVNPIPRGLWQDKPLIGIDYAIARGQLCGVQKEGEAGVGATISTGMIGLWK